MGSISDGQQEEFRSRIQECQPQIDDALQTAAKEFKLMWCLPECLPKLRRAAEEGISDASAKPNPNLRDYPFPRQAAIVIAKHVRKAAAGLSADRKAGALEEPSNEQIRVALEFFSKEEWRELVDGFEQRDNDTLRSYLDPNRKALEKWLGTGKFNAIFGAAILRRTYLACSEPGARLISVTDAFWAARIEDLVRHRNIRGGSLPSGKRSWDEVRSPKAISEGLTFRGRGASPYKVRQMLARMEEAPFEDFDGDHMDYFMWATNPKDFERHRRTMETSPPYPRRAPDTYFSVGN